MRGINQIQVLILGSLLFLGCAKQTPVAQDPSSSDEGQNASDSAAAESMANNQTLDVGMEFKDKNDGESRRLSHDAPPTGTWKPVDKSKAADPKADSKTATTASR